MNKPQESNGFHMNSDSPGLFNDFSDGELDASPGNSREMIHINNIKTLEKRSQANQDLQYMKRAMNLDQKPVTNEFFDFQEKISTIVEEQEEIFATHMQAIKVSAELIKSSQINHFYFTIGGREIADSGK